MTEWQPRIDTKAPVYPRDVEIGRWLANLAMDRLRDGDWVIDDMFDLAGSPRFPWTNGQLDEWFPVETLARIALSDAGPYGRPKNSVKARRAWLYANLRHFYLESLKCLDGFDGECTNRQWDALQATDWRPTWMREDDARRSEALAELERFKQRLEDQAARARAEKEARLAKEWGLEPKIGGLPDELWR